HVVDDPLSFLVDPYSVILTDGFASRLRIGAGAHLRLRTPAGIRTFTVRGILPPGGVGRAYGGNLLLMDVVGAQVVLGRDRLVDQVDVTLVPGVAVEEAARAMNSALASWPGLEAVPPARRGEQIERYLRSYRTLLSGISGLALLAAVFVAGSAVGTSVAARRREIGLLRCVGAVRRHVLRLVLGEALGLGEVAAAFALVILFMRRADSIATALLTPLRRWLGFAGRLAVDRLLRIPDQLALAAGVLALGLGLMLMSGTLARSFEQSVLDFIRHQARADLVVASAATTGWIETPVDESLATRLLAVPGVARVERVRLAEQEYDGSRISVDSLDEGAFAPERASDFTFAAGDPARALVAVRAGTAALVSRNFARQFRAGVGATLRVQTPSGVFTPRVAGVVVDYVSPRGSVVLSRASYQRWWGDRGVNRFHVTLGPGADAAAVRRAIAGGVGAEEGLKVLTQRELYAYHQDAVRRAFRFTRALEVLPLLV